MREIKFRGISRLTHEWVYGYYYNMNTYKNNNELRHIIVYENEGPGNQNEHEPIVGKTVGQYTGIKDMEDKKIYEGDIVRYKSEGLNKIGKIMYGLYDEEYQVDLGFYIKWIDGEYLRNDLGYWSSKGIKVIGNIYENKDLLDS